MPNDGQTALDSQIPIPNSCQGCFSFILVISGSLSDISGSDKKCFGLFKG